MQHVTPAPVPSNADVRRQRLGDSIAEARSQQMISVHDLADRLAVSERTITRWEAGKADLTFEQAIAIEEAAGWPRGSLGADGTYFSFQVSPACNEEIIDARMFDTWSECLAELQAAETLGLGVRLRNEFRPDGDVDSDGEYVTLSTWWVLELLGRAPSVGEPLD